MQYKHITENESYLYNRLTDNQIYTYNKLVDFINKENDINKKIIFHNFMKSIIKDKKEQFRVSNE
tara:strand:- start:430 stop:624 length:195 start_codon:yes stop_codon:yes gene_type:complete